MTAVTEELLRKMGFTKLPLKTAKAKYTTVLKWRGARFHWNGKTFVFEGEDIHLDSMEHVADFIQSLKIKVRTGVPGVQRWDK